MIDTQLFKEQKRAFYKGIEAIDPTLVTRGKNIYDFFIDSCEHYNNAVRSGLADAFMPLKEKTSELSDICSNYNLHANDSKFLLDEFNKLGAVLSNVNNLNDDELKKLRSDYISMSGFVTKFFQDNIKFKQQFLNFNKEFPKVRKDMESELYTWKAQHGHYPAYIIIAGLGSISGFDYFNQISKMKTTGDIVGKNFFDSTIQKKLFQIGMEDGAILLDANSKVLGYNALIAPQLNPDLTLDNLKRVVEKATSVDEVYAIINQSIKPSLIKEIYTESMRAGYGPDNARYFGFRQDVNARHLFSLYASYVLPGTVVSSLGEPQIMEDNEGRLYIGAGHIRRYQYGLITGSTLDKEVSTIERNIARIQTPGFVEHINNLFLKS